MTTVTIGARNQIVIPLEIRKKIEGLLAGRKVLMYTTDDETIVIKTNKQDWLNDSRGIMKDVWPKDVAEKIKRGRDDRK